MEESTRLAGVCLKADVHGYLEESGRAEKFRRGV
jgi:hypothetical protein